MARLRSLARAWPVLVMLAAPPVVVQVPIVRAAILALADALRQGGVRAIAIFVAVYCVGSLVLAPMAMLSGLAGFAWGRWWGLLAAMPVSTLGASTAFGAGRLLAETRWMKTLRAHPKVKLMEAVVRADGTRIAGLLRLSPVMPQNLLSYALGTTPLKPWQFALSTFLGMIPATALHVYVGSVVRDASELLNGQAGPTGPARWAVPLAGLVVTAIFLAFVMQLAKRQIAKVVASVEPAPP